MAIILLAAIAIGSFMIYNRMNQTYYIEYTETSSIAHRALYTENGFFEEDWVDQDQTYISSLIEEMAADFTYRLKTDSSALSFSYQYSVDAKLIIASKDSGVPYYTLEENILPLKEAPAKRSSTVTITETVPIDYVRYNTIANSFVDTYNLKNSASCTLIVTLDVAILSSNKQSESETSNTYTTSLNIPLVKDSFNAFSTSSSPDGEVKVLEYQNVADREIFYTAALYAGFLDLVLILALIVFLNLTKNDDITYAAKISKILRSYGTYIQRMNGEFNFDGYRIIMIRTFNEMLGIRDTIQAPVLMMENYDETMTRFFIPTNTNILYVHEIKADDYDEIYGAGGDPTFILLRSDDETEASGETAEAVCEAIADTATEAVETVETVCEAPVEETVEVVEETPVEETVEVVEETPAEETVEDVEETPAEETVEVVEETPAEHKILIPEGIILI